MTTAEKVYLDAQAACGLKVGDWVRVVRRAEDNEAGWDDYWNTIKDKTVGEVGQIQDICQAGINVIFGDPVNDCWRFPYFILEKVKKPACQFKPFDRVLVRDSDDRFWLPDFFSYYNVGADFPYICISGCIFAQCIPYEGNEHLAGTTGEPNG